jgi:hypothetical protein
LTSETSQSWKTIEDKAFHPHIRKMKLQTKTLILFTVSANVQAFCPSRGNCRLKGMELFASRDSVGTALSRENFLAKVVTTATTSAAVTSCLLPIQPVEARGRATLEYSCDRYYPRLEAGGNFYANDLKRAIEKNDWAAIKASVCSLFVYRKCD